MRLAKSAALVFALLMSHSSLASAAVSAAPPTVMVFGDSLAAGYGLPPDAAFPKRLDAKLHEMGVAAAVVGKGNSGDTSAGGLARIDAELADKPSLVILELGANDMLRGVEPDDVRANLDAMIKKIQASGAKVLLAGMLSAPNWGEDYKHDFDRIYPELAKARGVTLYPFFLDGVAMDPALNQPDGIHPNAKGVDVIVDRIAPVVAKMLRGQS
ncbi:MAG: arylesterase [Alphaproteobacteria bacterium]|nr:arylesterase [Alphaproteobacteria bacterium]